MGVLRWVWGGGCGCGEVGVDVERWVWLEVGRCGSVEVDVCVGVGRWV